MRALTSTRDTTGGSSRAFRGLILVFFLSFLNLLGVVLTAAVLGGLAPWTGAQFIGVFGVIEVASGLANVWTPNLWHLPVAEFETSTRTNVKLAWSALALPHWGGLARCAAGVVCLGFAAYEEGLAPASILVAPLVLALAWSILAISAVLARLGVARPDLDVFQLVVRWGKRENESRRISIVAAVFQFVLSIVTIPIVKLLPPSALYQPELGPSRAALLVALALAAMLVPLVFFSWSGRIDWKAPREQQREAEEHA
jgi:ABC-type multidrug transport system fused ATPase/permease subunit